MLKNGFLMSFFLVFVVIAKYLTKMVNYVTIPVLVCSLFQGEGRFWTFSCSFAIAVYDVSTLTANQ